YHFHLFLQTPDADLSPGMHDLESGYASGFNRRHERRGPLFQGRFHALLVERDAHDWELTRYVHLNPVRAGAARRPEDYPWGSCRFYFRDREAPPWLAWEQVLVRHGRTLRAARRAYARFLAEGVASPPRSPLGKAVASTLLGSPSFVERMRAWLEGRLPDHDVPAARALRPAVAVEDVERAVCQTFAVATEALRQRGRWGNEARDVAIHLCRKLSGAPVAALGARFGGIGPAAVSRTDARTREQALRDRALAARVRECEAQIAKSKK
ncbi:MAG: hypothetical protein FJ290_28330, partial [Planctomycetes bacterium]|nr:hypothetical protein [Planctomycetota bacterium]